MNVMLDIALLILRYANASLKLVCLDSKCKMLTTSQFLRFRDCYTLEIFSFPRREYRQYTLTGIINGQSKFFIFVVEIISLYKYFFVFVFVGIFIQNRTT